MTNRDHFYNIFWMQKSCYNLFLLSKEELLDTKSFTLVNKKHEISYPRIIISNFEENDINNQQIDIRNIKRTGKNENVLQTQIEYYTPVLLEFLNTHFGKAFKKITTDLENPGNVLSRLLKSFFAKGSFELAVIEQLQHYGLAGGHIKTFDELEAFYKKEFIQKKIEDVLSDETIFDVLTFFRNVKELYIGELYKGMYASNQVLVNSLNSEENFDSRITLFELLFEAELISYSSEDVFVECHHCDPGVFKGSLHVKLRPKKLKQLTCPVCQKEATYFASFEINNDLFNMIKAKDGLLLDALTYILQQQKIPNYPNVTFNELEGLEIDSLFENQETLFVVESKMFKLNTEANKLEGKIKRAAGKLKTDTEKLLRKHPINKKVRSILLVNFTSEDALTSLTKDVRDNVEIMGLSSIKKIIETEFNSHLPKSNNRKWLKM